MRAKGSKSRDEFPGAASSARESRMLAGANGWAQLGESSSSATDSRALEEPAAVLWFQSPETHGLDQALGALRASPAIPGLLGSTA